MLLFDMQKSNEKVNNYILIQKIKFNILCPL